MREEGLMVYGRVYSATCASYSGTLYFLIVAKLIIIVLSIVLTSMAEGLQEQRSERTESVWSKLLG